MKDNVQVMAINSEMAIQILEKVNHDEQKKMQRKIDIDIVNHYASEMKRKTFRSNTIHLMTCLETNYIYLVNGQHTLYAIIKSNESPNLIFREQEVPTYQEVIQEYTTYDHQRIRSFKDTTKVMGISKELGLFDRDIEKIATAIKYIVSGFNRKRIKRFNDNALAECTKIYASNYKELKRIITNGDISHRLMNKSIISIALLTTRFQPEKALLFWEQVAHGDKLSNTSPAFKLRREILENRLQGKYNIDGVDSDYFTGASTVCWNAFYSNRSIKRLVIPKKSIEVAGIKIQDAISELNQILILDESLPLINYTKTDFSKIKSGDFFYEYEGTRLERVTAFVKKLHPPFDKEGVAQKVALSTNRTVEQVKAEWESKGKFSRELGEKVHQYIEEKLNGIAIDALRYRLNGSTPKEFDSFDKFWKMALNEGLKQEKIEWVIGDKDYKLGGRIDALFSHSKDGYILADFKTGRIEEWNRDRFYPPFDDVQNDTLYQYSFQLSLYKIIIERNTNITINKMYIIHLKSDGGYEIIPAEDFSLRLEPYLNKKSKFL